MSSQPSTIESVRNTAASAADTVSNKLSAEDPNYDPNKDKNNFAKDSHGNIHKKGDFKDQLNVAAHGGPKKPEEEESFVEKIASYIPGLGATQQNKPEQGPGDSDKQPPGPPNRPDHDVQVEQFLRKQYHSQAGQGMPDPDAKD